jgi:hypothetical protein
LQIEQKEIEFEQIGLREAEEESDAYSLFVYAKRSQVTRDYYLRRLRIFFSHINLLLGGRMKQRCNLFAVKGKKDPNWAFSCIVRFLQYQKERVDLTLNRIRKSVILTFKNSDYNGLENTTMDMDAIAALSDQVTKLVRYGNAKGWLIARISRQKIDSFYARDCFNFPLLLSRNILSSISFASFSP